MGLAPIRPSRSLIPINYQFELGYLDGLKQALADVESHMDAAVRKHGPDHPQIKAYKIDAFCIERKIRKQQLRLENARKMMAHREAFNAQQIS